MRTKHLVLIAVLFIAVSIFVLSQESPASTHMVEVDCSLDKNLELTDQVFANNDTGVVITTSNRYLVVIRELHSASGPFAEVTMSVRSPGIVNSVLKQVPFNKISTMCFTTAIQAYSFAVVLETYYEANSQVNYHMDYMNLEAIRMSPVPIP